MTTLLPAEEEESPRGGEPEFNVEAAIAEFLADPTRASLELPRQLTAEQRKSTKKLADRHPELKCESYGFGKERQLHLFKKGADRTNPNPAGAIGQDRVQSKGAPGSVSVKNTFIDDWVAPDSTESSETIMFRSLPSALLTRNPLQSCLMEGGLGKLDLSPIIEGAAQTGAASSSRSTSASSTMDPMTFSPSADGHFPSSSSDANADGTLKALPALPEGLQVWNTFIHVKDMPIDERAVQSMPHNLFSQCLWDEAMAMAEGNGAPTAPLPTTPMPSSPPVLDAESIVVGSEVVIDGLAKYPAFNGRFGVVQGFDEEIGRYDILLTTASSSGHRRAKVKQENLRLVRPRPPPLDRVDRPAAGYPEASERDPTLGAWHHQASVEESRA